MSNNVEMNQDVVLKKIARNKLLVKIFSVVICVLCVIGFIASALYAFIYNKTELEMGPLAIMGGMVILAVATVIGRFKLINKLIIQEHRITNVIPGSEANKKYKEVKTGEVLLKVDNLSQHFGQLKAVDQVSFDVKKGEVFGLVGESGCGKTTTGRTIIKLYNPAGGNVYFKGERIVAGALEYKTAIAKAKSEADEGIKALEADSKANPQNKANNKIKIAEIKADLKEIVSDNKKKIASAKRDNNKADRDLVTQIQMIFQDPISSLDPRMTVRDIIAEGLIIHGMRDNEKIDEMVYKVLETVGLVREHASRYPHEFSGGQKQRIGVARAVIMNPEMIIADEPVSALDVSVQAQVINLLNDLKEELGLTILFIAHDLSVVKYFSDRIGVMYFGKMVELADSDELFAHPMHPYTRSLLSAIPLPDPRTEKNRKRIKYNPIETHDYRTDKPSFREISPNHFVMCNDAEEKKYKEEFGLN